MEVYRKIRQLSDEELERYVSNKIKLLESVSYKENEGIDLVGFATSYNPLDYRLLEEDVSKVNVSVKGIHYGYVRKNSKICYGLSFYNGITSNAGNYYYVDDDSYILDFCKYIKNREIEDEFSLFTYISSFLRKRFGLFSNINRDKLFSMISKSNGILYDPVNEHKFSSFKGTGAAKCTEFALAAGNILSFFDFDNYLIIGNAMTDNGVATHAFNIVSYTNDHSKEEETAIVDFASHSFILDIDFNAIGLAPYILPIENFNEKFLTDFLCNELHLVSPDYEYMKIGDKLLQITTGDKREYFVSNKIIPTYCEENYRK